MLIRDDVLMNMSEKQHTGTFDFPKKIAQVGGYTLFPDTVKRGEK